MIKGRGEKNKRQVPNDTVMSLIHTAHCLISILYHLGIELSTFATDGTS